MATHPPRIGITLGDPAGIGPELVLRLLTAPKGRGRVRTVIYGSAPLLRRVAQAIRVPWPADLQMASSGALENISPDAATPLLLDFPFPEAATIVPGRVQAACGRMAATWIDCAARDALTGRIDGMVTAPINKHALRLSGIPHPGHTEMLAALTNAPRTAMLFWSPDLVVSLATIHLPLADVPAALTMERLLDTIRLTAEACVRFGRPNQPIAVLALNPHAGEHGLFGDEEARIIGPAIAAANAEGIPAVGPLVPDTAFAEDRRAAHAAYVAMYHDQGLIPFKMLAFAEGVNVTLGLPIVRTSPDHGTAFDIAWQGKADPSSFFAAIHCAATLAAQDPAHVDPIENARGIAQGSGLSRALREDRQREPRQILLG
jgi:4-hydroxythreonine-4-phosphate dehydrogenase